MTRRTGGRETWCRLLEWDKSSGDSERLAAQILSLEGFTAIDPSHPLGGKMGKETSWFYIGGFNMITDTEIRLKGLRALTASLGDVGAERFISMIQREPFDYTQWRQSLNEDLSINEISKKAMALRYKNTEQ